MDHSIPWPFLLLCYAPLFVVAAPLWWPVLRLCLVAPLRRDQASAKIGCVLLYALSLAVPAGTIILTVAARIPSGVFIGFSTLAGWLPFAFALMNDPFIKPRRVSAA